MVITGDYKFDNGVLDLKGYTLTIDGNLIHSGGTMNINKGTLNVLGDYRYQSDNNGKPWRSSGNIWMVNEEDRINITGNYDSVMTYNYANVDEDFTNQNAFIAGVLTIGGDFKESRDSGTGYSIPFKAYGTHKVVLGGSKLILHSKEAQINILELVSPKCSYIFTYEPCWKTLIQRVPNHRWSEWRITEESTYTANGLRERTCTICHATEKETIPKIEHDWGEPTYIWSEDGKCCTAKRVCKKDSSQEETENATITTRVKTAASCTVKGTTAYTAIFKNSAFKTQTKDVQDIAVTNHKWSSWNTTKTATCTVNGSKTRTCSVCQKDETQAIAKLGHNYKKTVILPTCTTNGYTNHKCTRCGDEYNDTETDMIAHKFGEWIVTTKPTCTAKGVETRKCENCDKTETREVNALGHKYGDWDIKAYESQTGVSKFERKCINCTHYESKTEKNTVLRYAGAGRFATAAEISKATFDSAKTVVLAYGLNYADALAGVPLAAKNDAPILLTNTKTLPQETLDEIKRLGATNAIILGGEGAIGTEVENALKKEKINTQRIAGKTRFSTATAIAQQLTKTPEEIFFVYAFNFADALSASTVAAVKGAPIIYLKTNGDIDADTAAYLAKVKGSVKKAYVIGGTGVISNDMMNKAKNALGLETITRVAGENRYATCIEVNNTFKNVLTGSGICVAKGLDFPDALAGGVFAALKKMPLFLADGNLKDVQTSYLGNKDIGNVYVFGGTGAVPNELVEEIAKAS